MKNNDQSKLLDFINDCQVLHRISISVRRKLVPFFEHDQYTIHIFKDILSDLEDIVQLYGKMATANTNLSANFCHSNSREILVYKYRAWMKKIIYQYSVLLYNFQYILIRMFENYATESLSMALQLIKLYNELLNQNVFTPCNKQSSSVVYNSTICFEPVKKFTLSKILKIIAHEHAQICSNELIENLYNTYNKMFMKSLETESSSSNSSSIDSNCSKENLAESYHTVDANLESDTTSIIIYKTLVQYASPPISVSVVVPKSEPYHSESRTSMDHISLFSLVTSKRNKLSTLLSVLTIMPFELLDVTNIKVSKKSGIAKVRNVTKYKIGEMYEQILWEETGIVSEHVLLWWAKYAVGTNHQLFAQRFKAWLQKLPSKIQVPKVLSPIIQCLVDSLCCYITSTCWDELFRQAMISSNYQHGRHVVCDVGLGTKTGHLFSDMFYDLVFLNNGYEDFDQTLEDIENLPLVEQIPLLHRLDHSIHTARIWALGRAKYLANCWNMEQFFRVTHTDINGTLYALNQLKFSNNDEFVKNSADVHFIVCAKMRTKLVSEININIEKLQAIPNHSLSILSSICRVISLAHLRIHFPSGKYWCQQNNILPTNSSDYVNEYLDEVLKPVLNSSENLPISAQKFVSKLVLTILCEAWLDHIYIHKIKFSEWGAMQLLTDFNSVTLWLKDKICIGQSIYYSLSSHEVLKRCIGVGRLLLRQPGEPLVMKRMSLVSKYDKESEIEDGNENSGILPPEMYVSNQEQWLALRADQKTSVLTTCCQ